MARPYLTFVVLALVTVGYMIGNDAVYDYQVSHQRDHTDPQTGTWKADYDWQAANRRTQAMTAVRRCLLIVVGLHAVFNCIYAVFAAERNMKHWLAFVLFGAVAIFVLLVFLMASLAGARMVGSLSPSTTRFSGCSRVVSHG